jgi:hypothetical protein
MTRKRSISIAKKTPRVFGRHSRLGQVAGRYDAMRVGLKICNCRERATKGPRDVRHLMQHVVSPFDVHVADLRDDHGPSVAARGYRRVRAVRIP